MRLSRRHGLFIGIGLLLIFIAVEIQSYVIWKAVDRQRKLVPVLSS